MPGRALEPLGVALEPGRHPLLVYLGTLAPSGRRSQAHAARVLAGLLCGAGTPPALVPWHRVGYAEGMAVRAVLAARYAPGTTNRVLACLRAVVRQAWLLGLATREQAAALEDLPGVKGRRLPAGRLVAVEEIRALWATADPTDRVLLALCLWGGLRRAEACAVLTEDLVAWGAGSVTVRVRHGKGDVERDVVIPEPAAGAVKQAARARAPGRLLPLTPTGLYERLRRLQKRAGVAPCSPHDLRRSYVSHSLAAGVDVVTVGRAAGHADPRTTSRYDRRADEALGDAARALGDRLSG